ncbi:hypothetical protein RJ639_047513 [Escallonia herrerae]|uniref:Uncharacterized protein n=1 Tax=Escallonia herrerae TaxID=1293975 RepID=A0AA89B438_9ASTE|nr:hypothetical protein RJ639_047513 [Escallonia herrerae]
MEDERETSALRHRRKKSSMSLSSCFHRRRGSFDSSSSASSAPLPSPNLKSPPPSWLRSKAHELPEFRGKCRSLMSKMGRHRRHSSDFSYDPLSYALNFEEDDHGVAETEEAPFRDFASRLPSSPPTPRAVEGTQRLAALNVEMPEVKKRVELLPKGKVARLPLSSPTSRSGSPGRGSVEVAPGVASSQPSRKILVEIDCWFSFLLSNYTRQRVARYESH